MAVLSRDELQSRAVNTVHGRARPLAVIAKLQAMHLPVVSEPDAVYPESAFEGVITEVVHALLNGIGAAVVVPRFGLDIAVFTEDADGSRAFLIEVKSFNGQRQGGIGFGNARGEGPQVHLLLCNPDQMSILDRHVRWAFVDARRPHGSSRYAVITPSQACGVVMGEVRKGKHNNFGVSRLAPHWTTWHVFCEQLSNFLLI